MNQGNIVYSQKRRRQKWIEWLIFFICLLLIQTNVSFESYSVFIYTFSILLFSIRYGLTMGLAAIFAVIVLHLYSEFSARQDWLFTLYTTENQVLYAYFLFLGLTLGLYRTNFQERYEDLTYEKEEWMEKYDEAVLTLHEMREANDLLKKKILQSENNLATVHSMMTMLDQDVSEKVLNEAARIIQSYYGANSFGIYHVDSSLQVLRLKIDMSREETIAKTIFIENIPLAFQKAVEEKTIYVKNIEQDHSDQTPLITAPIIIEDETKFLLMIHEVDFVRLTAEGLEILRWMIQFIADPLTKTLQKDEKQRLASRVDGTEFVSMEYFYERLNLEQERYRDLGQPFSYFTVALPNHKTSVIQYLSDVFDHQLREVDLVGLDLKEMTVHFLLPGTLPLFEGDIKKRLLKAAIEQVMLYE
ncbi:hypothetical protein [Bacillus sp. 2205SS5-2]|uniref:hypothetical protein n=1 Tax=Bacillus sp. 2205SS5-2 TaxID=3109031 RepID=UPI003005A536